MIRATAAGFFVLLILSVTAAPAQAHAESAPAATNYLSTITDITPRSTEVTVRLVAGGSRMELTTRDAIPVVIYGYSNEPYLRLANGAVFANTRSASAYINEDLPKTSDASGDTAVGKEPRWRKIASGAKVRWHDHRTHWMNDKPPSIAEPGVGHRLSNWNIRLDIGGTETWVRGTLDYLAPPRGELWWAVIVVAAGPIAILGWLRRSGPVVVTLAVVLAIAAVAELADGVARVLDTGARSFDVVTAVFATETYGTLTALAALAAAGWALSRRPAAPFALALAAACLAVLGAFTDIAVFTHGRATAAWSGEAARIATATTLASCVGVAIAGWSRMRRDGEDSVEVKSVPSQ